MPNNLSRRDFLKGMATVGAVGAMSALVGCGTGTSGASGTAAAGTSFEKSIKWDAEYDVVVLGGGFSGMAAAITASDLKAKTVLIDKAPKGHEGGNSRYSGQGIGCPKNLEDGIKYYKGLRGGYSNMTDEIIETFVKNAMENRDWIIKTVGVPESRMGGMPWHEYKELPGGETNECLLVDNESFTGKFFQAMQAAVASRPIDCWYEAPGYKLVQDPDTKIIHGVTIKNGDKTYNVRAKNGVIMATGGFENNIDYIQSFVQMPEAYSKAARYNEGDGIRMGVEAGAMLWHMSSMAGCDPNFVNPDTKIAAAYSINSSRGIFAHEAILVGGDGTRFMDETVGTRHGHVDRHGTWISLPIPTNAWCVFDSKANAAAKPYPTFSDGCADEIKKGWVITANSIAELAKLMKVDEKGLAAEIEKYNGFCAKKVDADWGRADKCLLPIKTGPFYAFPIKPTFTNTQGGPQRNTEMEVVNPFGEPIPHLYSAGENGSIFSDIYQGGSNIAECCVSGRISGKNAAAVKSDVSQDSILKANAIDFSAPKDAAAATTTSLGPNQYSGTGTGIGGDVNVVVTYENGAITKVDVVKQAETEGVGSKAIASMPDAFVGCKTADDVDKIDGVTGATVTSKALRTAVKDALSKVK